MAVPPGSPMGSASDPGSIHTQVGMAKKVRVLEIGKRKCIVLFSSGIDSLACLLWAKEQYGKFQDDVTAMYVDIGTKYATIEIEAIKHLLDFDYMFIDMLLLGKLEGSIGHIPMRNIFLLELAALYSDNIVFGMLKGELSEDKGPSFIRRMQKLFDSQTVGNLYHGKSKITIHTPFANMTKTEVVAWLLSRGVTKETLSKTIGCLNGVNCGQCISCFNRAVAFINNGLYDVDSYSGSMHPIQWGLIQLYHKIGTKNVSLWKKRYTIMELWKAYSNPSVQLLTGRAPFDIVKEYIRA